MTKLNQEKLQFNILDHCFDSFWLLDVSDFRLVYANKKPTENLLGYPIENYYDNPLFWLSLVHELDKTPAYKLSMDCMANGTAQTKYRMRKADGSYIQVLVRASLIKDDQGQPQYILGNTTAISE